MRRAFACDNVHRMGQDRRRPKESICIFFVLPRDPEAVRCRVTAAELRLAQDYVDSYNNDNAAQVKAFEIEMPPALAAEIGQQVRFVAFSIEPRPRHGHEIPAGLGASQAGGVCATESMRLLEEASDELKDGTAALPSRTAGAFTSGASESMEFMASRCQEQYCGIMEADDLALTKEMMKRVVEFQGRHSFVSYIVLGPSEYLSPFAKAWYRAKETESYQTDGPRFMVSMMHEWSPVLNQSILMDWQCSFLQPP